MKHWTPAFYILAQPASTQMCFIPSQNFLEEVLNKISVKIFSSHGNLAGSVHYLFSLN